MTMSRILHTGTSGLPARKSPGGMQKPCVVESESAVSFLRRPYGAGHARSSKRVRDSISMLATSDQAHGDW
jgi:hypothetical protein